MSPVEPIRATGDILVIAADRGRARLFSIAHAEEQLLELNDLVNANARMPAHSQVADRQGRMLNRERGSRVALGTENLQDESARRFAHEVGAMIAGRLHTQRAAGRLFVVADPEFLGMLRMELRARRLAVPVHGIAKNVTRVSPQRIRGYLPKRLWRQRILGVWI